MKNAIYILRHYNCPLPVPFFLLPFHERVSGLYIFFLSAMIASTKKMMIRKQYMNVLTCKITSLVHSRKYIKLYLNKVNYKYKHRCLKPAIKKCAKSDNCYPQFNTI